jgi:SAM-dependent methyltransferase
VPGNDFRPLACGCLALAGPVYEEAAIHTEAYDYLARQLTKRFPQAPPQRVLEFGSLEANGGSARALLPPSTQYLGVDVVGGPGVDLAGDPAKPELEIALLDFGPLGYDLALCAELLQHTPKPAALLRNAYQALRQGGVLLLTCALDPRPRRSRFGGELGPEEHYANVDPEDLQAWLHPFAEVEMEVDGRRGDLYAAARKPE